MPTLTDIARLASVSASTVSRVLSDQPHVNETTRTKVLRAAQDLGYSVAQKRRAARRSVFLTSMGPRPQTKAAQHPIGQEFTRLVLAGAQSVLEPHSISTRGLTDEAQHEPAPFDVQHYTSAPGLAGLLLLGGGVDAEFAAALAAAELPFVIVGGGVRYAQSLGADCVTVDYRHSVEQVVAHLVAAGRRRIALVNGPDYTTTSLEKALGFRAALALHDLPFDKAQVVSGDFTPDDGYQQTLRLLAQTELDAIIYGDDYQAMGGVHALKESGQRVPHDVAVVGFHDYDIARFTDPPLSSLRIDMWRLGAVAARRLLMRLDDAHAEPWSIVVPTSLTVRDSSQS